MLFGCLALLPFCILLPLLVAVVAAAAIASYILLLAAVLLVAVGMLVKSDNCGASDGNKATGEEHTDDWVELKHVLYDDVE